MSNTHMMLMMQHLPTPRRTKAHSLSLSPPFPSPTLPIGAGWAGRRKMAPAPQHVISMKVGQEVRRQEKLTVSTYFPLPALGKMDVNGPLYKSREMATLS